MELSSSSEETTSWAQEKIRSNKTTKKQPVSLTDFVVESGEEKVGEKEDFEPVAFVESEQEEQEEPSKPFQSTATPPVDGAHYLVWNEVGSVLRSNPLKLEDVLRVEFSDADFHPAFTLKLPFWVLLADLSTSGLFLVFRHTDTDRFEAAFRSFAEPDEKLLTLFVSSESPVCAATAANFAAVVTLGEDGEDSHRLRVFSIHGREFPPLELTRRVLALAAVEKRLAVLCENKILLFEVRDNLLASLVTVDFVPQQVTFFRFDACCNLFLFAAKTRFFLLSERTNFTLHKLTDLAKSHADEFEEYVFWPVFVRKGVLFFFKLEIAAESEFPLPKVTYSFFKETLKLELVGTEHFTELAARKTLTNILLTSEKELNENKRSLADDKETIIVINSLLKKGLRDGIILDYVKDLKTEAGLKGCLKLCRAFNLFKVCNNIENQLENQKKKFITNDRKVAENKQSSGNAINYSLKNIDCVTKSEEIEFVKEKNTFTNKEKTNYVNKNAVINPFKTE